MPTEFHNFASLVSLLIQDEQKGTPHHERVLDVGETPNRLVKYAGFPPLDVVVTGKTIGKMCFDHGINTRVIQKIPELIVAPKALYRSASQPDSAVVFTYEFHLGSPVIMAIHKECAFGGGRICNRISSMYAKQNPNIEALWKSQGLLLWEVKKTP